MATAKNVPAKRPSTALAAFKSRLAEQASKTKAIEDSAATLGNWITVRAGVMKYKDNTIKGNTMPVVIVAHRLENAYFDEDFDPDTPRSPVCFAFGEDADSLAPHKDSEKPQATLCKDCKWNAFQTAKNGKGKACKNTRRLGMIHADSVKGGATEVAKTEIAMHKLPVTSVINWSTYVNQLAGALQTAPIGAITEFSCAPHEKNQVQVNFELVKEIDDEEVLEALFDRLPSVEEQLVKPYPKNQEQAAPAKKAAAKKVAKRKFA